MSDILPDDERVLVTLTVAEWVDVCHAIVRLNGPEDPTYKRIRLAVATGN